MSIYGAACQRVDSVSVDTALFTFSVDGVLLDRISPFSFVGKCFRKACFVFYIAGDEWTCLFAGRSFDKYTQCSER